MQSELSNQLKQIKLISQTKEQQFNKLFVQLNLSNKTFAESFYKALMQGIELIVAQQIKKNQYLISNDNCLVKLKTDLMIPRC